MKMKTRKILLIAADLLLAVICIFQFIFNSRDGVKVYKLKEIPEELIIYSSESEDPVILTKKGEDWVLGTEEFKANPFYVDAMIQKLSEIKAVDKVGSVKNEAFINRYELNEEHCISVMARKNGEMIRSIQIGKNDSGNSQVYATIDGQKDIYLVAGNLRNVFGKSAEELRYKIVYEVAEITSALVTDYSQPEEIKWNLSNSAAGDSISWLFTSGDDVEADPVKAAEWFRTLSCTTVKNWLPKDFVIDGQKIYSVVISTGTDKIILDIYSDNYGTCNLSSCPFELTPESVARIMKTQWDLAK